MSRACGGLKKIDIFCKKAVVHIILRKALKT